jgi:hypothetical protein
MHNFSRFRTIDLGTNELAQSENSSLPVDARKYNVVRLLGKHCNMWGLMNYVMCDP